MTTAKGKADTLTALELRFVDEYVVDLNAGAAYQRAGGSATSARTLGPKLLQKATVQAAIAAAESRRAERTEVTQDLVIKRLWAIASAVPGTKGYSASAAVAALVQLGKHTGGFAGELPAGELVVRVVRDA